MNQPDVHCPDPECRTGDGQPTACEFERDAAVTYWACPSCGYTFGYRPATGPGGSQADECSLGIPEALRRAASPPTT